MVVSSVLAVLTLIAAVFSFASCGEKEKKDFKVGICNYVDDASLNQIVENVRAGLEAAGKEKGVTFEILYENCNADSAVLSQIIANFISKKVDLMIGIATPVAIAMQAATEDNRIPVVFAAVSDPLGAQLVASLDAPGANITGTSDRRQRLLLHIGRRSDISPRGGKPQPRSAADRQKNDREALEFG